MNDENLICSRMSPGTVLSRGAARPVLKVPKCNLTNPSSIGLAQQRLALYRPFPYMLQLAYTKLSSNAYCDGGLLNPRPQDLQRSLTSPLSQRTPLLQAFSPAHLNEYCGALRQATQDLYQALWSLSRRTATCSSPQHNAHEL